MPLCRTLYPLVRTDPSQEITVVYMLEDFIFWYSFRKASSKWRKYKKAAYFTLVIPMCSPNNIATISRGYPILCFRGHRSNFEKYNIMNICIVAGWTLHYMAFHYSTQCAPKYQLKGLSGTSQHFNCAAVGICIRFVGIVDPNKNA